MKIEILMATYNGEKYIREQIESVINQTYKNWTLSIRDDCSNDKTIEIIEEYTQKDSRIKLIKGYKNIGFIRNFEELLKQATGELLFLSDQDDVWYNNKIEICKEKIKGKNVLIHNADVTYDEKPENNRDLFSLYKVKGGIHNFFKPAFTGCCLVITNKFIKEILPIPKNFPAHDIWIGLLAYLDSNIKYIDDRLMRFRRHGGNTSFTGRKSKNNIIKKLKFRYCYTFVVFKGYLKLKKRRIFNNQNK